MYENTAEEKCMRSVWLYRDDVLKLEALVERINKDLLPEHDEKKQSLSRLVREMINIDMEDQLIPRKKTRKAKAPTHFKHKPYKVGSKKQPARRKVSRSEPKPNSGNINIYLVLKG